MSRAGRSFFWFSFWVLGCGLALALFPRLLLDMAGITVSSDIMVRVFGTVLLSMGVSYLVAARRPSFAPLYLASVYTRISAPVIVGLFVLLTKASPFIVAFTGKRVPVRVGDSLPSKASSAVSAFSAS